MRTMIEKLLLTEISFEPRYWLTSQISDAEAWKSCPRGDWMLCFLYQAVDQSKLSELRKFILVKAKCVEAFRHLIVNPVCQEVLDVALRFGNSTADCEAMQEAVFRMNIFRQNLAKFNDIDVAIHAVVDSVNAARVGISLKYAYAASVYGSNYDVNVAAEAEENALRVCADIVRNIYPQHLTF